MGRVLLKAHEAGCKFDGWQEHYDHQKWLSVFEEAGVDPDFYALRSRSFDELLPWDFIDIGVTKEFLQKEWEKSTKEALTPYCREGCSSCGVMQFSKGWKCHEHYTV